MVLVSERICATRAWCDRGMERRAHTWLKSRTFSWCKSHIVRARMLAFRFCPNSMATSPKYDFLRSVANFVLPSFDMTSSTPALTRYISLPGSPAMTTSSPGPTAIPCSRWHSKPT